MSDISIIRHESIFNPHEFRNTPVHIIGAGATGSRVFMALVELGITNISIYDFDVVEAHNLANQIYLTQDIGKDKVAACRDAYILKTGIEPPPQMKFISARVPFEGMEPLKGIVFLLTDTMASRREIHKTCLDGNLYVKRCIETRMASSYGNVLCFTPGIDAENDAWVNTLIDDGDAEVSPCGTSISVGPTASIIANLAVWQMILMLTDPEGHDQKINIFLKPAILAAEKL